ncbi:MAG: AAA family ATPase [Methylobacterium organophilum]|jgi:hypothetical protein|nr:AAA family ATPase [Methylobacterium organophilum]
MKLTDSVAIPADAEAAIRSDTATTPAVSEVALANLRPIRLALHGLGPFRGLDPTVIDFLTPSSGEKRTCRHPCDVFVIVGDNGTGKSSVLEAIHGLFDLLSSSPFGVFARFGNSAPYPFARARRPLPSARLDMFADCSIDGHARRVLVTLWHGSELPPGTHEGTDPLEERLGGRERILIGFTQGTRVAAATNDSGLRILKAVRSMEGTPMIDPASERSLAAGFRPLPIAMHFLEGQLAVGRVSRPSVALMPEYAPARAFEISGDVAGYVSRSFRQLGLKPLQGLLDELGDAVFLDSVPRSKFALRPGHRIQVERGRLEHHGLLELGTGETALLALHANGWLHMTTGALLLIDALDSRVARKWHEKLAMTTLRLAQGRAGAMVILTTRDTRFADTISDAAVELGLACAGANLFNDHTF